MKFLTVVILALSFGHAFAQSSAEVFANDKAKINLVRSMAKILQVNFGNRDWYVDYMKGVSGSTVYNVEFSDNFNDAIKLTDSEIKKFVEDKVRNPSASGVSLNPVESNYLQIAIQGTEYHHSWVMGNHTEEFVSFNINLSQEDQVIESISESKDKLDVTMVEDRVTDNGKSFRYYQRLIIDRSSLPLKFTISNWRPLRLESKKSVYIESTKLNPDPIVTRQTNGI